MSKQSNGMDDPSNRLNIAAHKEVKEGVGSPKAKRNNDFIRRNAELAFNAAQKRQEEASKEQIATRENKDTKISDSPSIETEEYKGIRENALRAVEGRIKENIAPESPNGNSSSQIEQGGLSRERLAELYRQSLPESMLKPSARTRSKSFDQTRVIKPEDEKPVIEPSVDSRKASSSGDRSISASDNTNASEYKHEIEQIQKLIDTEKPVYAYFDREASSVYITDKKENVVAKYGPEYGPDIANLEEGYRSRGVQRIQLEFAKMGIESEDYRLRPELELTAPQVEKPQDKKADAIEAKEAKEAGDKTIEMVRGSAFAKLGSEIRNQQVWSESAASWKNPRMDFKVMKESEPLAFRNQEDGAVTVTWDNNYSHPNETPVPLNYAERIINENGIDGVKWDLPTVYALRSEPKNLEDKPEVIVTDHKETANRLKDQWGYQSLGELKVGQQDQQQKWTSVKDFVGPAYADKLPVWMQKDDIHIEDFIEYQKNKSLTPQEFMLRAQGQPLEHETVPADAWSDRLKPEEHEDQGADIRERLSRVEKTFAKDEKGKQFNDLKKDLDDLYDRISKRSVSKEVSEQAEEMKGRADMYPIQIEAFFKLEQAKLSKKEDYEVHYNRMVKDMKESVEFMEKTLDQSEKSETQEDDSPARSVAAILRTGRVNFMQRVDFYGNDEARKDSLNAYDKLVGDVKAIEDRLLEKGISQKDIYKQVEGRVGYYEDRINVATEIGDIGREHSLDLEGTTKRIKQDLIEFEAKEDFVSSVENIVGTKGSNDKTRQFSEKVYDALKVKGVDQNRMRLSMGIIEQNKENITTRLDDSETTEIEMNEASKRIMDQVDQLLLHRNDSYINEPYADASAQFRREMGIRGTGETMA